MKTLVIHPLDATTDFLCPIYKDIPNCTVHRHRPGKHELKKDIIDHDRLIFLGHGTEAGLYDPTTWHPIIDSRLVYLLRDKPNSIYIWCNADVFVKKYNLKGFYTGMIISDYDEALLYSVMHSHTNVPDSNAKFAESVASSLSTDLDKMAKDTVKKYSDDTNPIIAFNSRNIFSIK